MSQFAIFEKKAYFIGTWKDDVVTDNIIKEIATLTTAEKGRKVKLKLGPDGIQITKSNFFLSKTLFDYIPLPNIYFMTINQKHPMCLLCITRDPLHKYSIVAFRCASELIAGTFVQNFKALKRSAGQPNNMELRKKDNGNWTLRERTNANSRRELRQLFATEPTNEPVSAQLNGGLFYKKSDKRNGVTKKPNIYEQTPYVPSSTIQTTIHTEVYTDDSTQGGHTIHNVGTQAMVRDDDTMSNMSDMSSIKGEMEALSAELKEVKYLLEKSTGISAQEHYRLAAVSNNNDRQAINYNRYSTEPVVVIHKDSYDGPEVSEFRSFGAQDAPKSRTLSSESNSSGPEHLIAKSYRNSTGPAETSEYVVRSEDDKHNHRIHTGTSMKGGELVEMRDPRRREPEYQVARHSAGLQPEEGVIYAAQREANVSTVTYPVSTLDSNRDRTGSVSSTNIHGNPRYVRGWKSNTTKSRMAPTYGIIPSVIERPIEEIYSRPVLIRRDYIVGSMPRRRSNSMYVAKSNGGYIYGSQVFSKEKF